MKQGKVYTTLVLIVFLGAVLCYFGFYIVTAIYAPLTTVTALEYEAGSGSYTSGYVVRREQPVLSHYEITTLVVGEGERVAKGQTLATGYRSTDAQDRQVEIARVKHQLEQLEYARTYSAEAADQAILDDEIETQLRDLCRYVARRDLNSAADRSAAMKGLILRRTSSQEDNEAMQDRILQLKEELAQLTTASQEDTRMVEAEMAGSFSGNVDGYEAVLTPESLETMTIRDFQNLEPQESSELAIGKLIPDSTWYYVTLVPRELVEDLRPGDRVPVTFSAAFRDDLTMEVERLGEIQGGQQLLILSSDSYLQHVTLLREQSADVVFSSYTGLRVPKDAIRVDEDQQTGVYILEGNRARWKDVRLLHDNGETYVVELDKSSTDNLWPGDEIIVNAGDLYNGKVMR